MGFLNRCLMSRNHQRFPNIQQKYPWDILNKPEQAPNVCPLREVPIVRSCTKPYVFPSNADTERIHREIICNEHDHLKHSILAYSELPPTSRLPRFAVSLAAELQFPNTHSFLGHRFSVRVLFTFISKIPCQCN